MKLTSIALTDYRNYSSAVAKFTDGINFVVGHNAQGKTNLLESIYLSSVGRSPKTVKDKQLINFNSTKAKIDLDFITRAGKKNIQIYLDKTNKKFVKVNNLNVMKLTELVGTLNVVYFSPDELKLIREVPEDRRKFLDVSISQFDKEYLYELLRYNKILKQRNAILKSNDSLTSKIEQLKLFTPQLISTAENIIKKRLQFIENIKKIATNIHKTLTINENLEIFYSFTPKINENIKLTLQKEFENVLQKELELGYTCFGPHRDDIVFKIDGLDCKYYSSQGQQRTVALVIKLALMEVIKNEIGEYPILLLDDVLSELDKDRQDRLLNMTTKYQTLITCTNIPQISASYNKIIVDNGTIAQ